MTNFMTVGNCLSLLLSTGRSKTGFTPLNGHEAKTAFILCIQVIPFALLNDTVMLFSLIPGIVAPLSFLSNLMITLVRQFQMLVAWHLTVGVIIWGSGGFEGSLCRLTSTYDQREAVCILSMPNNYPNGINSFNYFFAQRNPRISSSF